MKTDKIYDAVGGIDEKYIDDALEAMNSPEKNNKRKQLRIAGIACAAAAVLVAAAVFVAVLAQRRPVTDAPDNIIPDAHTPVPEDVTLTLETYDLVRENGEWRMAFHEPPYIDPNFLFNIKASITYESLDALLEAIKNDDFTDGKRRHMQIAFPADENGILLFDLDDPPRPVFPDGFEVKSLEWYGFYYALLLSNGDDYFWIEYFPYDDAFESRVNNQYTNYLNKKSIEILKETEEDGFKVYLYKTSVATFKSYRCEPEPGIYIEIKYLLKCSDPTLTPSETVPYSIRVFNGSGYYKYYLHASSLSRAYSVDELLSFGLTGKNSGSASDRPRKTTPPLYTG
ncbi:MAG: hypothetical protein IKY07_01805, partial [Clostridia bacterium]|nr:hypothetical protein [Clostridia bacterium]